MKTSYGIIILLLIGSLLSGCTPYDNIDPDEPDDPNVYTVYTVAQRTILQALSGTYEGEAEGEADEDWTIGFIFTEKYDSPVQRLLNLDEEGQKTVTVHGKGQIYESIAYIGFSFEIYFSIQEDGEGLILYLRNGEEYFIRTCLLDDVSSSGFKVYMEDAADVFSWITLTKVTNPFGLTAAQENVLEVLNGTFFNVQDNEDSFTFFPYDSPQVMEENVDGILIKLISHGGAVVIDGDNGETLEANYYVWKNGEMITLFSPDLDTVDLLIEIISATSFKIGFVDGDDIYWLTLSKEGNNTVTDVGMDKFTERLSLENKPGWQKARRILPVR